MEGQAPLAPGCICAVDDSVMTPMLLCLLAHPHLTEQQKSIISNRLKDISLGRKRGMLKRRPCVVTSIPEQETTDGQASPCSGKVEICAITSYSGTPFDKLPKMLKFFTLPIETGIDSLKQAIASFPPQRRINTTPQWVPSNSANQPWLIAFPYEVDAAICSAWTGPTFSLDTSQQTQLTALCKSPLVGWLRRVAGHSTLLDECLNSIIKYGKKSTSGNKQIFSSMATMPDVPSNSSVGTWRSHHPRPSGVTSQSSFSPATSRFDSTLSMSKSPAAASNRGFRRRRRKVDETLEDVTGRIVNLSV